MSPQNFADLIKNAKGLQPPQPSNEDLYTKYVPFRPDQLTNLDVIARELMAARSVKGGPRITANTLIRIAVDSLVELRERLSGDNEAALRRAWFDALGINEAAEGDVSDADSAAQPPSAAAFTFPLPGTRGKGSKNKDS